MDGDWRSIPMEAILFVIISLEMALGDVKNFANNISHVYQCFLVVFLSRSEPVDLTSLMTLHRLNVRNNEESRVK